MERLIRVCYISCQCIFEFPEYFFENIRSLSISPIADDHILKLLSFVVQAILRIVP